MDKTGLNVIQRIRFPHTIDDSDLYMRSNSSTSLLIQKNIFHMAHGGTVSLNTYFNSFYEKYYAKYTVLCSLYYVLDLEGDFTVFIYRESYAGNRQIIDSHELMNCSRTDPVKIGLPDFGEGDILGRIYPEITCMGDFGIFGGGFIATDRKKGREVSLGIITCTFNREKYLRKTIETILQDRFLGDKTYRIFLVDNGRTLKEQDFHDKRIRLIANRNFGGSGGFSRGLIEALKEDGLTHFLMMDDDIELESESIYRLFPLYEYAKQDFAVSGSMLDIHQRHVMYEAGAVFNTITLTSLRQNLGIEDPAVLNVFLLEGDIDYGAFCFFSFPREVVLKTGLLMPFFVQVDDIEFGLRITRQQKEKIVAFPGIAVWHASSDTKNVIWDSYYYFRNALIADSLYNPSGYLKTITSLTYSLLIYLLSYKYNMMEMIITALNDYLKGPSFIQDEDAENLHDKIVALSKKHACAESVSFDISQGVLLYTETPKFGIFGKILMLLNLNGHLFPNFFRRNNRLLVIPESSSHEYIIFGKADAFFCNDTHCYQNTIDKAIGFRLLIKYFATLCRAIIRWRGIRTEWKASYRTLTSFGFWEKYLGIGEEVKT